jgi:hypothetical protein
VPNRLFIFLALTLLPIFLRTALIADSPFIITPLMDGHRLGLYVEVFEDPSGVLDLDAIRSGKTDDRFIPGGRDIFRSGIRGQPTGPG